jgi:cobalt/nickel transport system permease protein
MTYRYIFVLLRVTEEMFVARRSRLLAAPTGSQARQVMVRTGGVLLARSIDQSQQIYQAMVSRGFSGDVRLMEPSMLRARDWVAMIAAAAVSVALIAWGRR